MQADRAALDELGDDERLVLTRVARRMWEAVGDDYVHDVTNVVANIDRIGAKSIRTKAAFCPKANVASPAVPISPSRPDGTPSSMPPRRKTRMTPTRPRATSSLSTSPTGSSSRRSRRAVRHCPRERRSRRSRSPRRRCSPRWSTPAAGGGQGAQGALDDDESHSGGIGTPATRANIIEQLVHSGYVDRKGKQLRSTDQAVP